MTEKEYHSSIDYRFERAVKIKEDISNIKNLISLFDCDDYGDSGIKISFLVSKNQDEEPICYLSINGDCLIEISVGFAINLISQVKFVYGEALNKLHEDFSKL